MFSFPSTNMSCDALTPIHSRELVALMSTYNGSRMMSLSDAEGRRKSIMLIHCIQKEYVATFTHVTIIIIRDKFDINIKRLSFSKRMHAKCIMDTFKKLGG